MMESFNGIMTGILIVLFLGICGWAWSKQNKEKFEKMAHLPLEEYPTDEESENVK